MLLGPRTPVLPYSHTPILPYSDTGVDNYFRSRISMMGYRQYEGKSSLPDPRAQKFAQLIDSLQTDVSVQQSQIDFAEHTVNTYKNKLATLARDIRLTLGKVNHDRQSVLRPTPAHRRSWTVVKSLGCWTFGLPLTDLA
jgi:hypothetical protein